MKISLELDALNSAFDTVTKLAPPSSGNITISSVKGRVSVVSLSDISRCAIVLPCKVDTDGDFAVPLQALRDAVKGRKELVLNYANTMLNITSGSYKAVLATVDVVPLDELDKEETVEWKITAEQGDWLKTALKAVALKPTVLLSSWMPAGIKLTDKGAFVACFDTQHMSWVNSKEITGDFECVLPIDTMQNIMDAFSKSAFVLEQGKSFITVRNKLTKVVLNVPTTDDLPSLQQVREKIIEAGKVKAATFTFAKADLDAFLANSKAVLSKERAELVVEGDKEIRLSIKTVQGEVKAKLKGTGKGTFKIDLEYLQELTSKAPEEITLNVVDGAFLSSKLNHSSAIVALNQ